MHDFIIRKIQTDNIELELQEIGFDRSYIDKAKSKFEYHNFKIYDLTIAQANILKQTALSVGADCGTHKEVITGKIEKSSCLLGGSSAQIEKISKKLCHQPFGLKILGEKLLQITTPEVINKTKLMGILNITQNSFSDGGNYFETNDAIEHLNKLISDGADIIDIGAESTKPYSTSVPPDKQLEKLLPILEYIKDNKINIPISIDTRSAQVAQKCIEMGANIINDVSGFDYDNKMVDTIAKHQNVKVIIQHSLGTPETMQNNPTYDNIMNEIWLALKNKVEYAISKGIKKENIIIDPGIGFGKNKEHNFELINRWKEFKSIGCEVLIGLSRKSLLGLQNSTNEEKDIYSLAINSILINQGIDYIRVHNVKSHKKLISILS